MKTFRIDQRPRRNRQTASIRSMVRENRLHPSDFILPLFVVDGQEKQIPIESMPDCFRLSPDLVIKECQKAHQLGIPAVALFPSLPDSLKDKVASESINPEGLLQRTISQIKSKVPEITVITDVAMDPYSIDGHDGLVQDSVILNDETLEILVDMAVSQAAAGADIIAPSDMMDARVGAIRQGLDQHDYTQVGILAYSAKYASAFYGPFRDALNSEPRSGDKKTYQMDPANRREAMREILLDVDQGADMVMVKPAIIYLDVIAEIKSKINVPVVAYNVSGEYAMIKSAAKLGWLDGQAAMVEMLTAIKRSGADIILTYFAKEMAELC